MRGFSLDVELDGGLDGATVCDDSPEPDDEDLYAWWLRQDPRSALPRVSEMRRHEST